MDNQDNFLINNYLESEDEKYLEVLINKYLKSVYNFIYQYLKNEKDSEDITQEAFLKVWKNLKKFDQNKNFKTWIFVIAKNTCLDFLKKKKPILLENYKNEDENNFLENIPDEKESIDIKIDNKILIEKINTILNSLPLKYKLVITMHYTENLSIEEISEILKESPNTIKSRLRRGILYLKKELNAP